ncbi:MAG TPA: DsbA family protein [Mycobacteriales bacterium]|nr:DsbA family protein [Mycobacteriales bacterium]
MTARAMSPAVVTVWSDISCPWACLAVHRLWTARERLGLVDQVTFDHRVFALEVVNEKPTPRLVNDAEIPVIGGLAPDAGWQVWSADAWTFPVTVLPAMEAVQAAKAESLEASARLDRALRNALFGESRCISLRHVIVDVAKQCGVDSTAIAAALDEGTSRGAVMAQHREAIDGPVRGSPHLFLPDGTDVHNPGITMHWAGPKRGGFPVVDHDDPTVYDDLLQRAAN